MPELTRYAPAIVKSRPRRWFDTLRSYWTGPLSLKSPELAKYFSDGVRSTSGIAVNQTTAFTFSAVFDAVNQISSDVAKLPLVLRKRRADGGSDPYYDSRLYRLLKSEPNPEMGSMVFRRTLTAHALTWHGGFAEIERNGAMQPIALWPLNPSRVTVERTKDTARRLIYTYRNEDGTATTLNPPDVFHLTGLGFDPHVAYSTIALARQAIGLALAAEQFGASFFGNGATFGGVLSSAGITNLEQAQALQAEIDGKFQGADRAHKLLVAWGDWKYSQTGVAPDNAQMNELRSKQVEEVARFYNMPVHKLKNLDRATNNNIEQQDLEYYKGCLLNWITLWEEEGNRKLISPLESRQQFIKHNVNAFLRGDTKSRAELYGALLDRGVYCADDVLDLEDMNPQPAGQGKIFLVNSTMAPKDRLIELTDAKIESEKQKAKPQPAPAQTNNNDAELEAAKRRAAVAEALAAEAREEAQREREARIALEANTSATVAEREAARVREQAAIELATTSELVAAEAKRDVDTLREQLTRATAALAEAEARATGLEAEAASALAARQEAELARESAAAKESSAIADLEAARARVAAIESELDLSGDTARAASAERDALQSEVTRAQDALTEATRARETVDAEIVTLRASEAASVAAMDAAVAERDELLAAIDAADVARRLSDEQRQQAEQRADDLKDLLAKTMEGRLSAEAQLIGTQQTVESLRLSLDAAVERQSTAALDAVTAKDEAERARQAADDALNRAKSAETALEAAKAALRQAKEAEDASSAAVIAAHRALVCDVMRRMVDREVETAHAKRATTEKLRAWMTTWYDGHEELMTSALLPAVTVHAAWVRSTVPAAEIIKAYVTRHIAESKRQIAAVLDGKADELSRNLSGLLRRWEAERVSVFADELMAEELEYVKRRHAA